MSGDDLCNLLKTLTPSARNDLRRVLISSQADRDAIASRLMRYPDENGQRWADVVDLLTMYPEARRKVVRLLGELGPRARRCHSSKGRTVHFGSLPRFDGILFSL